MPYRKIVCYHHSLQWPRSNRASIVRWKERAARGYPSLRIRRECSLGHYKELSVLRFGSRSRIRFVHICWLVDWLDSNSLASLSNSNVSQIIMPAVTYLVRECQRKLDLIRHGIRVSSALDRSGNGHGPCSKSCPCDSYRAHGCRLWVLTDVNLWTCDVDSSELNQAAAGRSWICQAWTKVESLARLPRLWWFVNVNLNLSTDHIHEQRCIRFLYRFISMDATNLTVPHECLPIVRTYLRRKPLLLTLH